MGLQVPSTSRPTSPNCLQHKSAMAFGASMMTSSHSNLGSRSNSPADPPMRCSMSPELSTQPLSPVEGSDEGSVSYRASLGLDAVRQSDMCNASYGWGN